MTDSIFLEGLVAKDFSRFFINLPTYILKRNTEIVLTLPFLNIFVWWFYRRVYESIF